LYDFEEMEADYNVFIERCQRVWETLAQNEDLVNNMVSYIL